MTSRRRHRITLSTRERDTVLAALRHWQRHWTGDLSAQAEWLIATDSGPALEVDEIDLLCDRVNR